MTNIAVTSHERGYISDVMSLFVPILSFLSIGPIGTISVFLFESNYNIFLIRRYETENLASKRVNSLSWCQYLTLIIRVLESHSDLPLLFPACLSYGTQNKFLQITFLLQFHKSKSLYLDFTGHFVPRDPCIIPAWWRWVGAHGVDNGSSLILMMVRFYEHLL